MSSWHDMRRKPRLRLPLTAVAAVLSLAAVTGCSTTPKAGRHVSKTAGPLPSIRPAVTLQLRLAMSTAKEACRLPALNTSGAGTTCSLNATASYKLGPSLGEVTVAHAAVADEFDGVSTGLPIAVVELDEPGTATFARVTATVTGKQLAILLHGRVVNAYIIRKSIRDGRFALTSEPPDAKTAPQLVATLNAR